MYTKDENVYKVISDQGNVSEGHHVYHYISIRMASDHTKCWRGCQETKSAIHCCGEREREQWFSVFSSYSRSYSVHFSFFTFFSDSVIIQVDKWMFLVFNDFQFLAIFHVLLWTFLNFPPFSVFLVIFHVLKFVFLFFRDFMFSRHIPGPTVCISNFSRFSVISSFFKSSMDVSHFPWFSVFLPNSMSYTGHF